MKERSKRKLTYDSRDALYTVWLLDLIIRYGIENPVLHETLVGKAYDPAGFNWMSQAISYTHVRFGRDSANQATVMFTKNAQKYLEARS